jgi:2-polyprenyl-3-methyl-5-hydroxy-6-metoxy-1,4-benzoquinol methylase
MFNKDPELSFQFKDSHSPHSIVLKFIKPNQEILDVGCNTGYVGEYLIKNKNCICDGIDYAETFLEKARRKGYRDLFKIDLYGINFKIDSKYDILLFIDVLEHLPNPYGVLLKLVEENLKLGGTAIICLPNIARFEHRISHIFGCFDYKKSGIMHQDHLRFFTKKTARKMIEKTPLKIKKIVPTGLGHKLKMFPGLTAFQFIFICQK